MVNCTATGSFRWLVIDLNEGAANLQAYPARAGDHLVPNDGRSQHDLEELDRGCRVRSEDMGVIEADSHSVHMRELLERGHGFRLRRTPTWPECSRRTFDTRGRRRLQAGRGPLDGRLGVIRSMLHVRGSPNVDCPRMRRSVSLDHSADVRARSGALHFGRSALPPIGRRRAPGLRRAHVLLRSCRRSQWRGARRRRWG